MSYERVVSAALAETASKFKLAEALALDIPPRRRGPIRDNGRDVVSYLDAAHQAIIDAGGEPRSVETLRMYRTTALWVCVDDYTNFRWLPGVSYSAHDVARRSGLTYDEFVSAPSKTVRDFRTSPERPENVISTWTPEQKANAARGLLSNTDTARAVFADPDTARTVVNAAPAQIAQAQAGRHRQIRDHVAPPGSAEQRMRDQSETRYQVLDAVQRMIQLRLAVAKIPEIGMITEGEREIIVDEARRTLPTVEFLAGLTADQAGLDDEVAEFLRGQV